MHSIKELMSHKKLQICERDAKVIDAAKQMRDNDIGDVIVCEDDGSIFGILTDRDIAIRLVAEGLDPEDTMVEEICTIDLVTLSPTDDPEEAVTLMRQEAVRRLPVVEGEMPVGIVTIGDLALDRDDKSALADISSASPNR